MRRLWHYAINIKYASAFTYFFIDNNCGAVFTLIHDYSEA